METKLGAPSVTEGRYLPVPNAPTSVAQGNDYDFSGVMIDKVYVPRPKPQYVARHNTMSHSLLILKNLSKWPVSVCLDSVVTYSASNGTSIRTFDVQTKVLCKRYPDSILTLLPGVQDKIAKAHVQRSGLLSSTRPDVVTQYLAREGLEGWKLLNKKTFRFQLKEAHTNRVLSTSALFDLFLRLELKDKVETMKNKIARDLLVLHAVDSTEGNNTEASSLRSSEDSKSDTLSAGLTSSSDESDSPSSFCDAGNAARMLIMMRSQPCVKRVRLE